MNTEVCHKANQAAWSRPFMLGFLILYNSEEVCLPQAFSTAKKEAVHLVSG